MNKWLDEFKIALIEENIEKLTKLHSNIPVFHELKEMKSAKALIEQAIPLLNQERNKVKLTMEQIKKAIKFQRNSIQGQSKFDKSY